MNKKWILMALAAVLMATAMIGGTLMYFQADGGAVQQQVNTKSLKIALDEAGLTTEIPGGKLYIDAVPGKKIRKEVRVRNTADTTLYTRITIKKYWGDYTGKKENLMDLQEGTFTKDFTRDASLIHIEEGPKWLMVKSDTDGDEEEMILYCTTPVKPGTATAVFMQGIEIAGDIDNTYADKAVQLEVTADAVQYLGNEETDADAMLSEWGVYPIFDGNGIITAIEE